MRVSSPHGAPMGEPRGEERFEFRCAGATTGCVRDGSQDSPVFSGHGPGGPFALVARNALGEALCPSPEALLIMRPDPGAGHGEIRHVGVRRVVAQKDEIEESLQLVMAGEAMLSLQQAGVPRSLVRFTALPVLLARGTLDRVEREGPGAKLSRDEVSAIVETLDTALSRGEPALS